MTMPNIISSNDPALQDALGRRLRWAVLASLVGNLLLWRGVAAMARQPMRFDPRPVEITRVILQPNGKRVEKTIKKETVAKKQRQAPKEIPKPKPPPVERPVRPHIVAPIPHYEPPLVARHTAPQPVTPTKAAPVKPLQVAKLPQPPTAHNRILTAPEKAAPAPNDHVALAGGNADLGKPTNQQGAGDARSNPDAIVKNPVPQPAAPRPEPAQPRPDPKPQPASQPSGNDKKDAPTPEPEPQPKPKPDPLPEPKPKKKGATREAEPADQVKPDIPDELKHGDFKSFVRVAVNISADGSFDVTLRTSSGNQDVDSRVLEALKKWKWKPALKNGEPVDSVQRFKFEFEVQ